MLANSFERIHRSNLIGMGVLPLELPPEHHPATMALRPGDRLDFTLDLAALVPSAPIAVRLRRASGEVVDLPARLLAETTLDCTILAAGGLIPLVLERHLGGADQPAPPRH